MGLKDVVSITGIKTAAFTIPTATPEADGTIEWESTTIVLVEIEAGNVKGLGYTYGDKSVEGIINTQLAPLVDGRDVFELPAITASMIRSVRNNGARGVEMMAVSAVDIALWDLKAKLLDLPLVSLLGTVSDKMLLYGSGGFTTYTNEQLEQQFAAWSGQGIRHFKMKVGANPNKDVDRIRAARNAIEAGSQLFVDANGAFNSREALRWAYRYDEFGVNWFEEPVPSDDIAGLSFIRDHAPYNMAIVAGEYGYTLPYFKHMLETSAVDILQGDATRCGGISGFLKAGYLCEAYQLPYSSHCAPAVHLHAALSLPSFHIAEYFFDHARIEELFFDGNRQPVNGFLAPDMSRSGLGLEVKWADINKYKVS